MLWIIPFVDGSNNIGGVLPSWIVAIRGGGEETPHCTVHSMVAVFQLDDSSPVPTWLVGNDSTSCSCLLFGSDMNNHQSLLYRIPHLPSDSKLMQSLGLLSDMLILWLPPEPQKSLQLLNQMSPLLHEMAQERHIRSPDNKGRLVIVSSSAEQTWWVQEVVQQRLQSITPLLWESFDILTPQQLHSQWQKNDTIWDGGSTIHSLLPYNDNAQAVVQLLKQIYSHLGGTVVDTKDLRWFELRAMSQLESSKSVANETPERTTTGSEDPQDRIERVLSKAQQQVANLESKLQQIQLQSQSSNHIPLLDFGDQANSILEGTYKELEYLPSTVRTSLLSRLVVEVHQLYRDQLQSLRDYYGRRYELTLEQTKDEAIWTAEAEHMTQGFQTAAQHAIPSLCQPGAALSTIVTFDAITAFQGLVQDMLEATQLCKDEQSLAFDEDDFDNLSPSKRRIPKWVKKVASRAIALGINYVQGWLAWQGVKRAALERDREMPKFPLF